MSSIPLPGMDGLETTIPGLDLPQQSPVKQSPTKKSPTKISPKRKSLSERIQELTQTETHLPFGLPVQNLPESTGVQTRSMIRHAQPPSSPTIVHNEPPASPGLSGSDTPSSPVKTPFSSIFNKVTEIPLISASEAEAEENELTELRMLALSTKASVKKEKQVTEIPGIGDSIPSPLDSSTDSQVPPISDATQNISDAHSIPQPVPPPSDIGQSAQLNSSSALHTESPVVPCKALNEEPPVIERVCIF